MLMRITDYMLVIPDIPLMIIVAALFGRRLINIIIIIGIIYWTSTARLVRAQVKSVRERVYVKRVRALGAGNRRLVFKHVLPQVTPLLIANTVLMVAVAIFAETYITFLGLGDPSTISWGQLIENAFKGDAVLNNAWWAIVPPGLCVTVVILACTMVGQSMEDALNPRLRGRPSLGPAVPAPAPRREDWSRVSTARRSSASRTSTSGSTCRAAASCTPCRASPSSCTRASGWGWSASPAAARRRRSWR